MIDLSSGVQMCSAYFSMLCANNFGTGTSDRGVVTFWSEMMTFWADSFISHSNNISLNASPAPKNADMGLEARANPLGPILTD